MMSTKSFAMNECKIFQLLIFILLFYVAFGQQKLKDCQSVLRPKPQYHLPKNEVKNFQCSKPGTSGNDLPFAVSYSDIKKVCPGEFYGLYPWSRISSTLTTWILPIISLIVGLAWESNVSFGEFIFTLIRWIGSPTASLMKIFENIRITQICADFAVLSVSKSKSVDPTEGNSQEFSQSRDSFYIMGVMNQYELSEDIGTMQERDLVNYVKTALFHSPPDTPTTPNPPTNPPTIPIPFVQNRKVVANELRLLRRRGVVPIYASFLWFVCSLVFSIVNAFFEAGHNATAHSLALGLSLCWLPVLVAASIVDRNPIDSKRCRDILNNFMRENQIPENPVNVNIFGKFAGQGRGRWHFGIGNLILKSLKNEINNQNPRRPFNWKSIALPAQPKPQQNLQSKSRRKFDYIHIIVSLVFVPSACIGAIVVTYFTPTVALGCRSLCYLLFLGLTTIALIVEAVLHRIIYRPFGLQNTRLNRSKTYKNCAENILRFIELINTLFLAYTVCAQTIGGFNFYFCTMFGPGGRYVVFGNAEALRDCFRTSKYWSFGTVTALVPMVIGLLYLMKLWLAQSYMGTVIYSEAVDGMKKNRKVKHVPPSFAIKNTNVFRRV